MADVSQGFLGACLFVTKFAINFNVPVRFVMELPICWAVGIWDCLPYHLGSATFSMLAG